MLTELVAKHGLTNVLLIPRVDKQELARYWSLCDASLVHLKDDPLFCDGDSVEDLRVDGRRLADALRRSAGRRGQDRRSSTTRAWSFRQPSRSNWPPRLGGLMEEPVLREKLARNSEAAAPLYSRERQARRGLNVLRRALGEQIDLDDRKFRLNRN